MPTNLADPFGERDLFLAAAKDWDCLVHKPITTKHQSVFWLDRGVCRPYMLAPAGGYHWRRPVMTLWMCHYTETDQCAWWNRGYILIVLQSVVIKIGFSEFNSILNCGL